MRLPSFRSLRLSRTAAVMLLGACAIFSVSAQESDTEEFDGKWTANFAGKQNIQHKASVVIANFGGTWQDQSGPRDGVSKRCRGKKFPITVQVSKPSEFEFTVWGSSVSPDCPDLSMSFQPAGPKTLQGKINRRDAVVLTRK